MMRGLPVHSGNGGRLSSQQPISPSSQLLVRRSPKGSGSDIAGHSLLERRFSDQQVAREPPRGATSPAFANKLSSGTRLSRGDEIIQEDRYSPSGAPNDSHRLRGSSDRDPFCGDCDSPTVAGRDCNQQFLSRDSPRTRDSTEHSGLSRRDVQPSAPGNTEDDIEESCYSESELGDEFDDGNLEVLAEAVATLDMDVDEAEERLVERRHEVYKRQVELQLLQPSRCGLMFAPEQPNSDAVWFCSGDTMSCSTAATALPNSLPALSAFAMSASGRFIAWSLGQEVVLCETYLQSFRVAGRVQLPGDRGVGWLDFWDKEDDSTAILITCGKRVVGWEPSLPLPGGQCPKTIVNTDGQPDCLFLRMATSTQSKIVSASRGRDGVILPRENLMLGTEIGEVELWDLRLDMSCEPPLMVKKWNVKGDVLGAEIIEGASQFVVLVSDTLLGVATTGKRPATVYVYGVKENSPVACFQPNGAPVERMRMSYCERVGAFAIAAMDGALEIYSSEDLGPAVVSTNFWERVEQIPEDEDVADAQPVEGRVVLPPRPALAWCGDERSLLAVGGRRDFVLVFRYVPESRELQLASRLSLLGDGNPPRVLAWAPEAGVIVAAFYSEFRSWILASELGWGEEEERVSKPRNLLEQQSNSLSFDIERLVQANEVTGEDYEEVEAEVIEALKIADSVQPLAPEDVMDGELVVDSFLFGGREGQSDDSEYEENEGAKPTHGLEESGSGADAP